jgi:hypothetical protein
LKDKDKEIVLALKVLPQLTKKMIEKGEIYHNQVKMSQDNIEKR